jgi:cytochrome P450
MSDAQSLFEIDDPLLLAAPQLMYKGLRDATPVLALEGPPAMALVSTDEAIRHVLRHHEVFSSGVDAVAIGQIRPLIPLQIDPPEHSKFRKLLDPLFAPKRVAELEDRTRTLVRELIQAVVAEATCNFHHAVAEPLPSTVFLELLGLPTSRAAEFIELKDGIIRPPGDDVESRQRHIAETGQRIYAVLEEVVAARQAERQADFISSFLDAEVDGHRLTPDDVVDICYLFFLAGLDTVTASLDCMLAYLATHAEQRQQLVEDPALIPHAIEELLRWETPVAGVPRIAVTDTELEGCPIAKGTMVTVLLGSANTDERTWDDADTVEFDREANRHIAFGGGVHRCLGSHLARMELRVALEEWHTAVPEYRLRDGVELLYSAGLRAIENLELVW